MVIRYFAMLTGVVYTTLGLLGFLPSALVSTLPDDPALVFNPDYGYLLGLFPTNLLSNLLHLTIGIFGMLAFSSYEASLNYARRIAIFFGILTIFGLLPNLNTLFGLMPLYNQAFWLHGITALAAVYFGFGQHEPIHPTMSNGMMKERS